MPYKTNGGHRQKLPGAIPEYVEGTGKNGSRSTGLTTKREEEVPSSDLLRLEGFLIRTTILGI